VPGSGNIMGVMCMVGCLSCMCCAFHVCSNSMSFCCLAGLRDGSECAMDESDNHEVVTLSVV